MSEVIARRRGRREYRFSLCKRHRDMKIHDFWCFHKLSNYNSTICSSKSTNQDFTQKFDSNVGVKFIKSICPP